MVASFALSPVKASAETTVSASNTQQIQLLMQLLSLLQTMLAELQEKDHAINVAHDTQVSTLSTYANEKFGYSLQYPKNWKVVSTYGGDEILISAPDFKESASPCTIDGCDNNYTVLSGSQFIVSVSDVSGLASNSLKIYYDVTDKDDIGFKSHQWLTIDGKQSLITELERVINYKKDGFQTVRVLVPAGSRIYSIIYNFAQYTDENKSILESILESFDVKVVSAEEDTDASTENKPSITVWIPDSSVKFGSLYTVNWNAGNFPSDAALAFSLIASDGTAYRIKNSVTPTTSGSFQWTMNGVGCWGATCSENVMKVGDVFNVRAQIYTPINSCYDNQWSNGACPDGMLAATIVAEDRGLPFTVTK